MNSIPVTLTVNSTPLTFEANPARRLSSVLRSQLKLTGTKVGCDAGDCGACSVIIDGQVACACLIPVAQLDGAKVETVDGLSGDDS